MSKAGRSVHATKPKQACVGVKLSSQAEFGVSSELPALSVCRLEAREELFRKLRKHVDDPALADFSCPICFEPFWQPMRTVCGHAFCEGCLLKAVLAQLSNPNPEVSCPLCRWPLHADDVSADQALLTRIRNVLAEKEKCQQEDATSIRRPGTGTICRGTPRAWPAEQRASLTTRPSPRVETPASSATAPTLAQQMRQQVPERDIRSAPAGLHCNRGEGLGDTPRFANWVKIESLEPFGTALPSVRPSTSSAAGATAGSNLNIPPRRGNVGTPRGTRRPNYGMGQRKPLPVHGHRYR